MSSAQSRYIARLLPCVMHIVHMPASKARSWLHESIFNQFATTVSPLHIGDRSGVRWIATCLRADERLSVRQGPGGKTSNLDAASHADGFRSKDIPATVTSMQLQHSAGEEVSIGPAHRQHQILACWRKSVLNFAPGLGSNCAAGKVGNRWSRARYITVRWSRLCCQPE